MFGMYLTQQEDNALKEIPIKLWSTGPDDVGLMEGAPPVEITGKTEYRPKIKQYPLKPDAEKGITPVIESLLKAGVIVECPNATCMTPIFPVKKAPPSQSWRMVQDLRAVNNAVQQRAPNVPNPHMLLNQVRPTAKYYSVIDMANAFFSIPLTEEVLLKVQLIPSRGSHKVTEKVQQFTANV